MTDETTVVEQTEVEQPKFDAKQIEKEMIEMAQSRADDPAEAASTAYSMYVPHFKRLLPKMSTRGLRRILQFLVLYPLEKDSVNSANELEKQFMQLVNSLVEAKFVLVMDAYNKNAQQLLDAQSSPLTKEEEADIITELKAGGVSDEEITRIQERNKGQE